MNQSKRKKLQRALELQEKMRGTVDDSVIDAAVDALAEKLASMESPRQQRKFATILFMDIASHSKLFGHLDPEVQMEIVDPIIMQLAKPIGEFGGQVTRFQGDGYKAVFGLPTAQEQDPENAVLAALAVQEAASKIAVVLQDEHKIRGFQVRIGVHSGMVFVGGATEGSKTVKGLAVNDASHLEEYAEPGKILISADTYQHVRGVFDVVKANPVLLPGHTEPINVFVVNRAKPRAIRQVRRGVEGIEIPIVGREAELAILEEEFLKVIENSELRILMVVGETGIGKSRLIEEFENRIDLRPERVMFFKGRAWPENRHLARGLLRDVLAFHFQIQENERVSDVWKKLEQGIRASQDSWDDTSWKKRAHIIGQWLGFDFSDSPFVQTSEAQSLSDDALNYLGEYFTAITVLTPALVILEDVHWADESSLDALTDFAWRLRGIPLMVVINARLQLLERRADWDFQDDFYTRLDLKGLSHEASEKLVRNILMKVHNIPEQLISLIIENSGGNPYYIEEIIKSLVDDGVIIKGEDHWQIDDVRLKLVQIPASLTAILQARLDSLPAVEREALQQASVLGKVFWNRALTFIGGKSSPDETSQILSRLTRKELILREKTSTFIGSKEYIFKHAILQRVTYESVLIRQRRTYHGLTAEWLMDQSGDRSSEYSGQIAYHLVKAGKSDDALPFLRSAGIDAAKRFAHDEAITYITMALEILPTEDIAERFELLLVREASYHARGQRAKQEADLDRLSLLSLNLTLDQQAHASLRRSRFLELTGDYLGSIKTAQNGVALAQAAASVQLTAEGHWLWGSGLRRQSNFEEAERVLGRGVELGEACGNMSIVAACLRGLGSIAWNRGKLSEAKQFINKSLTITRNKGEKRGEINSLTYLGLIARGLHDLTVARASLEEAVKLSRSISNRRGEGWARGNLGLVFMDCGNFQRASDEIRRAISIFQDIDDEGGEGIFLAHLAVMAHRRGQREKAEQQFNRALDLLREIRHQHGEARALHDKGYFHLHHNELDKAESCFQKAFGIRSRINQTRLLIEDQAGLAAVSLSRGDVSKALRQIEPVLNQIEANPKLIGLEYPFEVFASSLKILLHARHPRTDEFRELAQHCRDEQIKRITSSEQEMFLDYVPYYKELTSIIESAQK